MKVDTEYFSYDYSADTPERKQAIEKAFDRVAINIYRFLTDKTNIPKLIAYMKERKLIDEKGELIK